MKRKANTSEGSSKDWHAEAFKHDSSGRDPPTKKRRAEEKGQPETNEPPPLQRRIYSPLEENYIRVLYLEPGEFDSDLRGSLVHIDLQDVKDDKYAYEAISYAWGEPTFSGKLYIKDCVTLRITSSLDTALRYLRWDDRARALWADAVCINQSDVVEKSSQVSNMHTVFNSAEKVQVWLGAGDESDSLAFCALAAADSVFADADATQDFGANLLGAMDDFIKSSPECVCCWETFCLPEDPALEGILTLRRLFRRPWFSRLWVVQEVFSAKRAFICSGYHAAPWEWLGESVTCLHELTFTADGEQSLYKAGLSLKEIDDLKIMCWDLVETLERGIGGFDPTAALANLCDFRSWSCSEPLDRLYALHKVLRFNERRDLAPDYSLSIAEAYSRLAFACIHTGPPHHVPVSSADSWFALVGTESERCTTFALPSWIPNLHRLTNRSERKAHLHRSVSSCAQFRGFLELTKILRCSGDFRKIWIRGRTYATVNRVLAKSHWPNLNVQNPEMSASEYVTRAVRWLWDCKNFVSECCPRNLTGPEFVDLLLCGLRRYGSDDRAQERAMYRDVKSFFTGHCHAFLSPTDFWLNEGSSVLQDFLDESRTWELVDQERQLCHIVGDGGDDIGWIPRGARVGDKICLIAGTQYPFVVRKYEDGCYQMLGDAYTSLVTLKEALGGDIVERGEYEVNQDRPDMSWKEDSREMRRLLRDLDWIALR